MRGARLARSGRQRMRMDAALRARVRRAVELRQRLEDRGAIGLDVLEPRATSDGRGLGLFASRNVPPGYEISIPATLSNT